MKNTYRRKRIGGLPPEPTRALDDEFAAIERATDSAIGETNLGLGAVTATAVTVTSDTGSDVTLPAATASAAGVATASQVTLLGTAVQPARAILAGTGLTGGGNLSADRTLAADFGAVTGKVCQGDDVRLGNPYRIKVAGVQVGALDFSNLNFSALFATDSAGLYQAGYGALEVSPSGARIAGTAVKIESLATGSVKAVQVDAAGNLTTATPVTGVVPETRKVDTATGLQGGGDLSADRTLSPVYGATANTVCQGNDARLSDARAPTAHATTHAAAGTDPITPAAIGAAPATHTHGEADMTDLDRMRFRSLWNATTSYVKNDVVIDGPYIAVAKAATTDKPAPVFTQDAPDWLMSDGTTGWQELTGQRFLGHRYGPLSGDTLLQGVRFFSLSASVIQYAYLLVNGVGRYDVAKNLAVPATTWLEIRFPPFVLRTSDVIDFVLFVDGTHKYSWGPDSWPVGGNVKSFESWGETYPPTEFGLTQFGADVLIQSGTMSANWSILCKSAT